MTLAEKMREVYRGRDVEGAIDVGNFCRARGWTYAHIVKAFAKANGLPEEDGPAEWEEIVKEAESWQEFPE